MTKRVNDISIPSIELRADALVAVDRGDPYRDWAQLFPCLNELQVMDVKSNHVIEDSIRIGSWNLERGKEWQRAADLIERENIEVLFLSEMDLGMSRSGQQHTAKELAARLGWHRLFAVEFVDLELGRIDWFFVKQLIAQHPKTIPVIGCDGLTISDHDLIICDLLLR